MSKVFSIIFTILVFLFAIAVLILGILINMKMMDSSYQFIRELGYNWAQAPIMDIYTSTNCDKSSLLTDKWPGTRSGCYCPITNYLKIGSCNKKRGALTCLEVYPIPPVPIRLWDGYALCKNQNAGSYLSLNVYKENCPTTHPKTCGVADTL